MKVAMSDNHNVWAQKNNGDFHVATKNENFKYMKRKLFS